ncbi:hypothetical protein AYJ54_02110 [Bradyrhizobium centrolobii]|uniref:Uncharacterized protein n=1 Tax=Bradyrhizobium centrolobii TaxID=1505087 RepID=A0A176YGE6_9BRAD|nr:hypothetical protein [Bradyrhizobium centrolobii]OAF05714.1 hypothetical protein AYJ54_02110 [Bradyrhizobium centrolobii]
MRNHLQHSLTMIARGDIRHILAICLAIYGLMLPVMALAKHGYHAAPVPQGSRVEQIFPRWEPPRWYTAYTHMFESEEDWNRIVVYEDTKQLPRDRYEAKPFGSNGWKYITLAASDGTNPAENGRHYYVVLP